MELLVEFCAVSGQALSWTSYLLAGVKGPVLSCWKSRLPPNACRICHLETQGCFFLGGGGGFGALQIVCNPVSNLQTRVCCAFLLTAAAVEPRNSCTSLYVMQEEMISKAAGMLQTPQDCWLNEAVLGLVPF